MDNHGAKAEDTRAIKRLAIAKHMAEVLELTGVDVTTRSVGGFTVRSQRSAYDDEVAHPSVSSPPGMYLVVSRNGGYDVHSSESLSIDSAAMGRMQEVDGTEFSVYSEPQNIQVVGYPGELVSVYGTMQNTATGSHPYRLEVRYVPAIGPRSK